MQKVEPRQAHRQLNTIGVGIILVVIWLGSPLYLGWMHFSLWMPAVWTLIVVAMVIGFGWRTADRGLITSWFQGLRFGAAGIFPVYFLAGLLSRLVN